MTLSTVEVGSALVGSMAGPPGPVVGMDVELLGTVGFHYFVDLNKFWCDAKTKVFPVRWRYNLKRSCLLEVTKFEPDDSFRWPKDFWMSTSESDIDLHFTQRSHQMLRLSWQHQEIRLFWKSSKPWKLWQIWMLLALGNFASFSP
jgi:hypothetical protein